MYTTGTADNWNYMEGKRLVVSHVVNYFNDCFQLQ